MHAVRAVRAVTRRDFVRGCVGGAALVGTTSTAATASASAGETPTAPSFEPHRDCTVFELRQYTQRGGRRDELIDLFHREFLQPQDSAGAYVVGTFVDLDDPDRFVWVRGFRDAASRTAALESFYGGEVRRTHRAAANATMLDSDNVLLLRPAWPGVLAWASPRRRPRPDVRTVWIHRLDGTPPEAFVAFFRAQMQPRLERAGARIDAAFLTDPAPNGYPRLPVRERITVFAWSAHFASGAELAAMERRWTRESGWRDAAPPDVLPALMSKPERLRLASPR